MLQRIIVRPAAAADMLDQAVYLAAHASVEVALRFYEATDQTFRLLVTQPEIGKRAEYHNPQLRDARMFHIKGFEKYLVFYRPLDSGIEVLRVIHSSRDIEALFENDD